MSDTPAGNAAPTVESQLEQRYQHALSQSGLPYRSPSHRIAEQLAQAARAHAYADALALVTGNEKWQSAAARLKREVEGRTHMDQSEIDAGDRAESTLGRYGLRGLR